LTPDGRRFLICVRSLFFCLEAAVPTEDQLVRARVDQLLGGGSLCDRDPVEVWGARYDAGLAWVTFPEGCGGLALGRHWQAVVDAAVADAGGSLANHERNIVGIFLAAPTLVAHASTELQQQWLRPIFTAEEIWCQLFSEPGAGSDLAGLATAAVPVEGGWRINGQKVWTTLAHQARWGLLLARTDPDAPKNRGITCFVVDMRSAGVDVRPLFEITGEAEFNEVYLDDVFVPDSYRLGDVGAGWRVATTTLMNERVMAAGGVSERGHGPIAEAVGAWEVAGRSPLRQDELVRHWVSAEALRLTQMRATELASRGTPGPEASAAKLRWAELNQTITSFTTELMGPGGVVYPEGYTFTRPDSSRAHGPGDPHKAFLRARANSIEGGTSEIMRNILAQRVLGLPQEKTDRETPWRQIPRG
jgi:alkylation response protein AidB-like acyl-CoA dehydrogenase